MSDLRTERNICQQSYISSFLFCFKKTLYAVIPAHTLFSKEANDRFKNDHRSAGRIRDFIARDCYRHIFSLQRPTVPTPEPLFDDPPLVGYRYVYRASDYGEQIPEYKQFMNDSALLQIQADKRDKAEELQRDLYDHNLFRQDELRPTNYQDLQEYHNRQTHISVLGFKGRLDRSVDINRDYERSGKGLRLTFTLKNG